MVNQARVALESALRARKLDRTLTSTVPACEPAGASAAATGIAALDACLGGGLPRGQLSELAGPASSGRTTLLHQFLAAATRRGEMAALVDTVDRLDVASLAAAGADLDRLLWIRSGRSDGRPGSPLLDGDVDRALKAWNLVLQAGGFGVVALDLADLPHQAIARVPFTTWLRVQRIVEGSDTACVIVVPGPLARSAGGLTVTLTGREAWTGAADRSRRLAGLDVRVRVVSPRRRLDTDLTLATGEPGDAHTREAGLQPGRA
jgi:recombination protein RecA